MGNNTMRNIKQSKFIPCYDLPLRIILSSIPHKVQIKCDKFGNISSTNKDQAEWIIMSDKVLQGVVILKWNDRFLSSNEHGQVLTKDEVGMEEKWIIKSNMEGYSLCSYLHKKRLACDGQYIFTVEGEEDDTSWNFEFQNGELCYIYSPEYNKRMRCNLAGDVTASNSYDGWEVWRFIEAGSNQVFISSWCHDKFLSSNSNGEVYTTENRQEKWNVEKDPLGRNGVLIHSVTHLKFLHCSDDQLYTSENWKEESAIWQFHEGHQNKFFISSALYNDKRVSTSVEKPFTCKNRRSWEQWKLEFFPGGFCTLYSSVHNKYLGSNSNGLVFVDSNANDWEKWRIEETSFGEYFIVSVVHKRFLACNKDGELFTSNRYNESEMWFFEPNMPKKVNKNSIIALSVAAGVGLTTTFVMPLAVVAAVRGIGFTAGGVAAGSTAAGMMSAEAVASGGVVAAGGVVATLQSVGAVGALGATGTSAAMAAGGLVGGTIVGVTAKGTGVLTSEEVSPNENVLTFTNRPFC